MATTNGVNGVNGFGVPTPGAATAGVISPWENGFEHANESAELAVKAPIKRLIVACDGTWQSSNHGVQSTPSNVAKLSRALAQYSVEKDGTVVHQICWYDAGVGTSTDSVKSKIAGFLGAHQGTWGEGLDENVCEAYNFLVNNYNPGDEIYFFGFSRGAYTVRACSGLVARIGLCRNSEMDDFYKMYQAYKSKNARDPIEGTEWGKSTEGQRWLAGCDKTFKIKAVGVWDTVGAVGWPDNVLFNTSTANKPYAFHNTDIHPEIENAFHALALDEHRAAFPPTLWSLPEDGTTNLIQCWFPGYHINSGGGSGDFQKATTERRGDFESMANITFAWMIDRIQQFTPLEFDKFCLFAVVERYARNIQDLTDAQNAHYGHQHTQIYRGWGIGPAVDSYNWQMALAGSVIRTPGEYNKDTHRVTHEHIHPVTAFAIGDKYQPKALAGFTREKAANGVGHVWRKTYTPSNEGVLGKLWSYVGGRSVPAQEKVHLEIPEYVIQPDRTAAGEWKCDWGQNMERHIIRVDTRRFIDDSNVSEEEQKEVIGETLQFIKQMDIDNGFDELSDNMLDVAEFFHLAQYQADIVDGWETSG